MSARLIAALGFATGVAVTLPLRAQGVENSPFLPAGGGAVPTAAAADGTNFELRGIMTTPKGTRFCIFDPSTKTGVWVGLNEKGHSFVVSSADTTRGSVSIQAGDGRHLLLAMRAGKVMAMGAPAPAPSQPAPGVGTVVLHPTPETEQARLAAITEEVRRRRLLREQAQNGQPAPPPGAPAQ